MLRLALNSHLDIFAHLLESSPYNEHLRHLVLAVPLLPEGAERDSFRGVSNANEQCE